MIACTLLRFQIRFHASRIVLIAALALLSTPAMFLAAAQQAPAAYPVTGIVLNSLTHQPIARALVDANTAAVLTDNEGHFALSLGEGMKQITIRRPGYGSDGPMATHVMRVGANMAELTFYLTPEAAITGHVQLSNGEDAEGVQFLVYRKHMVSGREKWMTAGMAITNSEGIFRYAQGPSTGSFVLCNMPVQDHFAAPRRDKEVFGFPSLCYPGGTDLAGATPLTITDGQQADLDITLTRQRFYPVSITVLRAPAQGMSLQVFDSSGRATAFSLRWDQQRGVAEGELPNGTYSLEARAHGTSEMHGVAAIKVANGPASGTLTLLPLYPIPVEVRKEFTVEPRNSQQPISGRLNGADAATNEVNAGFNLTLTPADTITDEGTVSGPEHPAGSAAGHFVINNAIPGRYWANIFSYDIYVSSITGGGVDLNREPLVVGAGNSTSPIQVTLRNDGGKIACTINPSSPGPETNAGAGEVGLVFVYAIPTFPSVAQVMQIGGQITDPLQIIGLAPGVYRVFAFDRVEERAQNDPQSLLRRDLKGQTVTVEAGSTVNVQLDVNRTGNETASGEAVSQ